MTLLGLAQQYRSDVVGRIETLEEELADLLCAEDADDLNDQIAHWKATLKQIDAVLIDKGSFNGVSNE